MITKESKPVVLRRRSWLIFCGMTIIGLGVGMSAAVLKVTSLQGFRAGWQGIPVYLGIVAALGWIANCKVILRDEALVVINPLRTIIIPKGGIDDVALGDDGALEFHVDGARKVTAFAFGGSLVGHIAGTNSKAREDIRSWLNSSQTIKDVSGDVQVLWTRCAWAEVSLLLCIVTTGVGGISMTLSG
ncbi:hypothetical protein AB0O68_35795 [Streptomyces sp. NPDC087512]|uniref:hypothetical protein n=1 Tax=Streptomyces sp. NPDC087512 TaxID=3155059 RepID=UPI00341B8816